jgi:hypothetical protein
VQVLHMVELVAVEARLGTDIKQIVSNRLKAMLR